MRRNRFLAAALAALLFLCGCSDAAAGNPEGAPLQSAGMQANNSISAGSEPGRKATPSPAPGGKTTSAPASSGKATPSPVPGAEKSFTPYQAPEFAGSAFHADLAEGDENVKVDLSAVSQGYVAVSAKADSRLKFRVLKGGYEYVYNMASDGTPSIFPLQCGDGKYTFQVMKQVASGKYGYYYVTEKDVTLDDEFQPFLRPSDYVNYSEDSDCVRKAAQLAEKEEDALGVVTAVFKYICGSISYDKEKAVMVQTNKSYLPDPDEIMELGKGICFDYAALTAAMLRSQGIPTKMVFGDVSSGDDYVYHAWNMIYTEETGWVAVEYSVKADEWNRLDLTFSAGGADSAFVGDGGNYTDSKYY